MQNLKYTIASQDNLTFINETYNENIESLHGAHRSLDIWKQLLAGKDSIYYIVQTTVPVAWFRIDFTEDELWLGMLQVKPAYHRMGIGKYIVCVVEEIARKQGFTKVGIHTTEDNTAARALYLSAGYLLTEIGPCTTADGEERVGYTFEKEWKENDTY